jgi:phosphinothricin acetyltransferase
MGRYHAKAMETPSDVSIRPFQESDVEALTGIYNHYIESTPITFDIAPKTVAERRVWLGQFASSGRHRLFVATDSGAVVGYAGTTQFRTKRAYDTTVETTVYCSPEATGRGIGRMLYDTLFRALRGEDVHLAIAAITLPNPSSVALHEKFGFSLVGVIRDVGRKFDRYWDVAWFQRTLD